MTTVRGTRFDVIRGGYTLARCDCHLDPRDHHLAHVRISVSVGAPAEVRREIVDRVLGRAAAIRADRLQLSLPLGDELITLIEGRCHNVRIRPAGSTCLIDAEITSPGHG